LSRHDIRQAARPSIPGGFRIYGARYERLRFRAGFKAPSNLAFTTATGRCRNSAESGTSVARASLLKPSTE
jgi:hypothetical protein